MAGGRPLKFITPDDLEDQIQGYFTYCDLEKKPYSITGLAVYLDTSRETLINYEERPEFFDAIKRAKAKCESWVEENAMLNKTNATFAIFNLKNNYGWKDVLENRNTVKMEVTNLTELSDEELNNITTASEGGAS